jgi:type I restriction enzyme R subunit
MLFGKLLSCRNIISCFDNFIDNKILPDFDFQEYKGMYLMIYQDYKQKTDLEKERINEDIVFEIELMKQVEINIDYILKIIEEYQNKNETIKEIPIEITRAINSSVFLLSKKDLIEKFVEQVSNKSDGEKD